LVVYAKETTLLCQKLITDARFFDFLLQIDRDLAKMARAKGCRDPDCGGPLHSANFQRKPRGGPGHLGPEHDIRFSFCCALEGCRCRVTPPSVRFLGRKVYFAAVIVLATAMLHGTNAKRIARIREWLDVSWDTLDRWRRWWRDTFAKGSFWRATKGRFASPIDVATLPYSLLARFGGTHETRLVCALKLICPLTTTSAPGVQFP